MSSEFEGKKAVITGGLGFIGSHLARRLVQEGANATLIDNLDPAYGGNFRNICGHEELVEVVIGDVGESNVLSRHLEGADFLFNLAGQSSHADSMSHPERDLRVNVVSQLALLEAARRICPEARVVFASTRQVYGRPKFLPVSEEHPLVPVDINGIHKIAAESYHRLYSFVHGLRATVLRLTNTYGPGMRVKDSRQTFVGLWLRKAIEGRGFEVFGNGQQLRDFTYVDDVVDAFLQVATVDAAVGATYNLAHEEVVSLIDLAELIARLEPLSSFKMVPFPPERGVIDIGDYYGDFSLIRSQVGWKPSVPLERGIQTTLDFFRENLAYYVDG